MSEEIYRADLRYWVEVADRYDTPEHHGVKPEIDWEFYQAYSNPESAQIVADHIAAKHRYVRVFDTQESPSQES